MTEHPLRRYRTAKDISLETLAKRVGSTKASLSRIETRLQMPSPALARVLQKVTGIPLWELRPDIWEKPKKGDAGAPAIQE